MTVTGFQPGRSSGIVNTNELESLLREIKELREAVSPEAWKAVAYEHGYGNFGAGYQVVQYRKTPFNEVEVRGLSANGEANKSAFTLPVGYRPKEKLQQAIAGVGATHAYIEIEPNGEVIPIGIEPGNTSWQLLFSLQ